MTRANHRLGGGSSETQKNSNADRFLAALEIREWGVPEFEEVLRDRNVRRLRGSAGRRR